MRHYDLSAAIQSRSAGLVSHGDVRACAFNGRILNQKAGFELLEKNDNTNAHSSALLTLDTWKDIVVAGGVDGKVRVWNKDRVYSSAHLASALVSTEIYKVDAGIFGAATAGGIGHIFDTERNESACSWPLGRRISSAILADCVLVAACEDGGLRFCDPRSGSSSRVLHSGTARSVAATALAWFGSYRLFAGYADGCIRLWDIRRSGSTACLAKLDRHRSQVRDSIPSDDEPWAAARGTRVLAHDTSVAAVLCLHDRIISLGRDGDLQVWHAATLRNTRASLPRLARARPSLAPVGLAPLCLRSRFFLAPSGSELYALSALQGGNPLWKLDIPGQSLTATAFSQDQHRVLAVDDAANLHTWKPKQSFSASFTAATPTHTQKKISQQENDLHDLRREVMRARRDALLALADQDEGLDISQDEESQPPRNRSKKPKSTASSRKRSRQQAPEAPLASNYAALVARGRRTSRRRPSETASGHTAPASSSSSSLRRQAETPPRPASPAP